MKNKIKSLNKLFQEEDFLIKLCQKSNNNFDIVLKNINKIIMFYLCSEATKISSTILNILDNITDIETDDFIFTLDMNTFSIDDKKEKDYSNVISKIKKDLKIKTPIIHSTNLLELLFEGISNPFAFLEESETPILLGEKEYDFYKRTIYKKFTQEKCKSLPAFVYFNSLLEKIKKHIPKIYVSSEDSNKKKNCINLPSYFKIIDICAKNKQINAGTPLQKWQFVLDEEPTKKIFHVKYTRLEKLSIDDSFRYANPYLTGNPKEDILLIYNELDIHNNKDMLKKKFEENASAIKANTDINATRIDGVYHITNGRHRLVYLRHYYDVNKPYYKAAGMLQELKSKVTIPMTIDYYIEDEEVNEIFTKLKNHYQNITIIKVNPNDDNISVLICTNVSAYYLNGKDEIINFYNNILIPEKMTKYRISAGEHKININHEEIFKAIYELKGNKIYSMTFIEIIKFLQEQPLKINKNTITLDNIDLIKLHKVYLSITSSIRKQIIFDSNLPIENNLQSDSETLIEKISKFLKENDEYLDLTREQLLHIIQNYELFRKYAPFEIKEALLRVDITTLKNNRNQHKFTLTNQLCDILKTGDKK